VQRRILAKRARPLGGTQDRCRVAAPEGRPDTRFQHVSGTVIPRTSDERVEVRDRSRLARRRKVWQAAEQRPKLRHAPQRSLGSLR